MGTGELLTVFAALMAVIAMLGVAVDWVGKPMRNRRFTPRIYRYADEHLVEVDPGRTAFSGSEFELPAVPAAGMPATTPTGTTDWSESHFVLPEPASTMETWGLLTTENPVIGGTFDPLLNVDTYDTYERGMFSLETMPMPAPPGRVNVEDTFGGGVLPNPLPDFDADLLPSSAASGAPLPDPLPTYDLGARPVGPDAGGVDDPWAQPLPEPAALVVEPTPADDAAAATAADVELDALAPAEPTLTFRGLVDSAKRPMTEARLRPEDATSEPGVWQPGDALWAPTKKGDPSSTTVRRRFWQSAAVLIPGVRWYGEANVDRMAEGKAPERRNRRSGKMETMQLSGLRSKNDDDPPRPHWPNEELDPFEEY